MMAHDKYYGQALREAESGKRHDDLWGRAFAMAKGDSQVASGFYIGLLAKRLEEEAGAPERVAQALEAKLLVGTVGSMAVEGTRRLVEFAFRWVIRGVICLAIAIGVTYGGTYVYSEVKAKELTDKSYPAHQQALEEGVQKFRWLKLSKGRLYPEAEIRKDFETLNAIQLQLKYDFDGVYELDQEFNYDPFDAARRASKVNLDAALNIGAFIFFGLFGGWLVLAWRRHFYVRKVQTVGPLPPVKV
jgi:hypothetical protein